MAKRQTAPRTNRYKPTTKNGKGKKALAVFLVALMAVLVAGYYFFAWQPASERIGKVPAGSTTSQPKPPSVVPSAPPPVLQQPGPVQQTPAPKPGGEYTGDTRHPESPPSQPVRPAIPKGAGQLAIIIDDMGSSLQEARSLAALGVPLTFSIIPGLRYDREVAAFAVGQGVELMVHMPMQSKEYPRRRLEANGLLVTHSDQELRSLVEGYFERVPQAVGANNHTGSAFTEDAARMRTVLSILKQRRMFFIDSVTTPATTGPQVAHELHLKTARRDVFLDNEQDEAYIRGQLDKAVERARRSGQAIAICHPHPTTIATLTKLLPDLQRREGVTLVFASRLVR